ncbi:MAG TPA: FAD-dependent oxidoreductase [Thiobacillaceae bacterium]|nr:FAD-dependent oxidoreductase [Thiobacillaceae bacterium]HNU63071.1 FAD-dependent oxidoreductase [Thiobacillaceae bacterium]
MATYHTHLQTRDLVAAGTMAFHLEKPAGFDFRPGQAMDVILPGAKDGDSTDTRHTFSIVSAPHEAELVFATRMRDSAYKHALGALETGTPLELDGPFGALLLHKNPDRAAVLIAGGIGITPFMSMLRHAAQQGAQRDLVLLYSNRRPEDAAFLAELQGLQQRLPRFHLIATMTNMTGASQPWAGATGKIDRALVLRAVQPLAQPIFYVSGPAAMVEAMRATLAAAGMDEDDVRSETFYGY